MGKELNILLVEDNPGDAFFLEEMLENIPDFKFLVKRAETLKETLKILDKDDFDIVLLDLGLPDSEHLDGLKAVLELDKQIPVVVITGLNDNDVGRKAVELGAQSYMIKGEFNVNSILQTILYSIDRTKILKKLRQKEKELNEKNELLSEANAAQNLLISIISHDVRGPVNSIIALLDIIFSEFDSIDDLTKKKYLKSILASAKNTHELMENLLEWAQIQSNRKKVVPERIDINNVLTESVKPLQSIAERKNIQLKIHKSENAVAKADKKMISAVVRNLVSNALKFTPGGGNVELKIKQKNEQVLVNIIDNGTGIDEDRLKSLFNHEKTASVRGTDNEPGSGFGLILCKEFIEKNNGNLIINSEPGNGTTVEFSLPAVDPDEKK